MLRNHLPDAAADGVGAFPSQKPAHVGHSAVQVCQDGPAKRSSMCDAALSVL